MKKTILALIAACIGCCVVAFLPAFIAGGSIIGLVASLGKFSLEALMCALPLGLISGLALFHLIKRGRPKKACASDGDCGCK